jgi:abhydrolase domain-containing protein 6
MMGRYLFGVLLIVALCGCEMIHNYDKIQVPKLMKAGFDRVEVNQGETHRVCYAGQQGKPTLVLVHGYGAGVTQYAYTARLLHDDFRVIIPELMHHGGSWTTQDIRTIDDQVEHLKTLLDSADAMEPVYLVGNSYGGIVSAYFAEKYPERVRSLVIYDSPVNAYSSHYADSLAKSYGLPSLRNILNPSTVYENRISLALIFHTQPRIPKFIRKTMLVDWSSDFVKKQQTLLSFLEENEELMMSHRFQFPMPVYLCWGDEDVIIPMSTCKGIQEIYHIPDSSVHVFRKAGHAANVEYPRRFARYLRRLFIEQP